MLSAHQPYERFPDLIREAAREAGASPRSPAACRRCATASPRASPAWSCRCSRRDVIAMSTAVALTHDMFDAALMLGICDKIVPGLLIGALAFGHLPAIFVPGRADAVGPAQQREARDPPALRRGQGRPRRAAGGGERSPITAPGTCTFYGTANSNQMLMEMMGLHLPGAAFVNPNTPLRDALTARPRRSALAEITALGNDYTPIGRVVDERAIVNAMVGLLATGGSTNHTLHLVAMARAAGIGLNWDDFADLSAVTPLLARIYPNGIADVNQFQAAGGMGFVIRELLDAGLLHDDVLHRRGRRAGSSATGSEPLLDGDALVWEPAARRERRHAIVPRRPASRSRPRAA